MHLFEFFIKLLLSVIRYLIKTLDIRVYMKNKYLKENKIRNFLCIFLIKFNKKYKNKTYKIILEIKNEKNNINRR